MDRDTMPNDQPATPEQVAERRRLAMLALSPEERWARGMALQDQAMALLRQSPEGWANFVRRNRHSRRTEYINGQWLPADPERRAALP